MKTAFLLMAQYNGKAIIPINDVCRDYFPHLTPTKLVQKISAGQIAMPLVRIERRPRAGPTDANSLPSARCGLMTDDQAFDFVR